MLLVAAVVFALSLTRLPRSPGFWLSSAAVGCALFALLWQYWRFPSSRFFGLLISAVVFPASGLADVFFGRERPLSLWPTLQYLSVTVFASLTLLLLLQRREFVRPIHMIRPTSNRAMERTRTRRGSTLALASNLPLQVTRARCPSLILFSLEPLMRYSRRAVAVMAVAAALGVARADARAPSALVQDIAHAPISDVSTRSRPTAVIAESVARENISAAAAPTSQMRASRIRSLMS